MDRKYLLTSINFYLAGPILLGVFLLYVQLEHLIEITNIIGELASEVILHILFLLLIGFYIYTFIKTKKLFYFTIPYLILLLYFAVRFWFLGFMIYTGTFM